jgi:hypothetical protein
MKTQVLTVSFVIIAVLTLAIFVNPAMGNGRPDAGVVYVTGQGLFFETFGTTPVPPKGPFQLLIPAEESASGYPETEYGPGDRGYVGGRWWVDVNHNGQMDEEDNYFQCPLLGPGQPTP